MKISILLSSLLLLLPSIYCKDRDDPNWMSFLPNHVVNIVKDRLTTSTDSYQKSSISIQESSSSESLGLHESSDTSVTPEVMYDYGDRTSSNSSVKIGVPIGSIIIIILICYCCFRCCRNRQTISQGIVVQQPYPPPPQPDPTPPNIVIQHIHANPPHMAQPQPQFKYEQPQFQHAPPQFQHAPPQQQFQQQQPPYPTGYETQQMLQQEWSPHAPMNTQYPAPADYPHNPSAPPPSYGKY